MNKMIEITGRNVKIGDLVLYSVSNGDISKAKHGIVYSLDSVFIKEGKLVRPKYIYLISNLDNEQKQVYNEILTVLSNNHGRVK